MCVVSAIYDYGRQMPPYRWDGPVWEDFQKLIKQAEEFDTAAGEPDCVDPKKAEWADLVERLVELRAQKDIADQEIDLILEKLKELK